METICLFGSDYETRQEAHAALKKLLALPEYYGMNADALNDCLSERRTYPGLWIRWEGTEEVQSALALMARVFQDSGGEVKEL